MSSIRAYTTRMLVVPAVLGFAALVFASSPVLAQDQNQDRNQSMSHSTAQMEMTRPAPILVIYKEDVKAGRVTSHNDLEANYARTYAKMPGARHYLAMESISGPNQAWFVQPYASLEDVEKEYLANDKAPTAIRAELRRIAGGELDNLTNQVAITTVYRDDLSYKADISNLPKDRYVEVIMFRVKPGHDNEFMEAVNLVRSAHEKANVGMGWVMYQTFAGAPSGTYYLFRTLESLTKADPTNREMMETVHKALGEDGQKRLMQLSSDCILMEENNFYAFDPKASFAPPEFAAADSFWSRPTQLAQVGTSGKSGKMAATKATKKQGK